MIKSCVALAVFLCSATPAVTHGQVFLASRPHPDFLVGPLFVVANVSPGLGPVTVNLSWSLTTRPTRRPVDIQQDLYLLWPAEVAESTAPGPAVLGLFALYYERRDRMVHLAREYSLVVANFADSDHLKIEEISPATAVRRQSRVRAGGEVVALTLLPSQDITTQSVRVQFHYFSGRINWRPIVISAVILLVTNFAGVLMLSTDVSRRIRRRRRARRRFGAASAAPNGSVPSREMLVTLIPAGTRYDEVVAPFARPAAEHERVTPPGRRTLLYRSTHGTEHHEVANELYDDRVREVTCGTSR